MKNCVKDTEAIEFVVKNARKIADIVGKVNVVFPSYKTNKEEQKRNYHDFSQAIARKNLAGYDGMSEKNRRIVELYELALALYEVAEQTLKDMRSTSKSKNFLAAACIL
ncbi:MAG: hypothetical protein L6Q29_03850 [Candidatus Pacebacteria bacterium]|nr:hypothetical protein [Candidatus Paceibacterota bacterium]NUQ57268.1 hypothetical protein [Candidatus Paceibacter sp.]